MTETDQSNVQFGAPSAEQIRANSPADWMERAVQASERTAAAVERIAAQLEEKGERRPL